MLKKLIAYDLKRTRPVMTGIVLFTFLLSIIIVITSAFKDKIDNAQTEQLESGLIQTHSENLPPIYFTISNIQTIALLAIPVLATLAAIYMLRYYYKTIYLTQGYLSFTLPQAHGHVCRQRRSRAQQGEQELRAHAQRGRRKDQERQDGR